MTTTDPSIHIAKHGLGIPVVESQPTWCGHPRSKTTAFDRVKLTAADASCPRCVAAYRAEAARPENIKAKIELDEGIAALAQRFPWFHGKLPFLIRDVAKPRGTPVLLWGPGMSARDLSERREAAKMSARKLPLYPYDFEVHDDERMWGYSWLSKLARISTKLKRPALLKADPTRTETCGWIKTIDERAEPRNKPIKVVLIPTQHLSELMAAFFPLYQAACELYGVSVWDHNGRLYRDGPEHFETVLEQSRQ